MSKVEIKGNDNQVYQNLKNSNVNSSSQASPKVSLWVKYSALIGTIAMIIAAIANWDKIMQLFQ